MLTQAQIDAYVEELGSDRDYPCYPPDDLDFVDYLVHLDDTLLESGNLCVMPGSRKDGGLEHIIGPDTAPRLPTDVYPPDKSVRRLVLGAVLSWVGVVLLTMLIGCNFTPPNLLIQPIHPQEISGQQGYLITLPTGGSDVAAFRILNWDVVNTKPVFVLVIFDSNTDNDVCTAISLLLQAKEIRIALQRPTGILPIQKKVSLVSDSATRTTLSRYLVLTRQDGTTAYLEATFPNFTAEFTTLVNKPARTLTIRGLEEAEILPPFTEEAKQKAEEVMERLLIRFRELQKADPVTSITDIEIVLNQFQEALIEVVGFNLSFVRKNLLAAYVRVNNLNWVDIRSFVDKPYFGLIEGYLRVKFMYPGKNEGELLDLFEAYVKNKSILMLLDTPSPGWG